MTLNKRTKTGLINGFILAAIFWLLLFISIGLFTNCEKGTRREKGQGVGADPTPQPREDPPKK